MGSSEGLVRNGNAGRDRLLPNVVSGWVAHGVTLVIGFVMPRLIDESVGQAALGVWDLGWSLVMYLAFSGLGIAAAITHHVAQSDADDGRGLCVTIASGFYCQLLLAVALGCGLLLLFTALPAWAPGAFAAVSIDMYWVGLYLGLAIVVAMIGDVAQGVLAGYHHSSWNEYLTMGADLGLAAGMIVVLLAGGGIVGLAMVTFLIRAAAEAARVGLAFRICPHVSVRPRHWRADRAGDLLRFASKTSLGVLQELLIHQGVRVLLAASAGPSVLAAYSRYHTIMRQIARLLERSVRVIPAMTSDLAGQGRSTEVHRLREQASRAAALVALPMIAVFAVFGDELVLLWMGPDFTVSGIAWVLAALALLQIDYTVSSRILAGLNLHGRIALTCFLAAIGFFAMFYLALGPLDAVGAAWLVTLAIGCGVSVPHYFLSCARLKTPPGAFFLAVYLMPLLANGAFLAGLLAAKASFIHGDHTLAVILAGGASLLLAGLYWRFGIDARLRSGLIRHLRRGV